MANRKDIDNNESLDLDKQEKDTGIPSNISDETMQQDQDITSRYMDGDNDVAEGIRTLHPNRNTDKEDTTSLGGYRD